MRVAWGVPNQHALHDTDLRWRCGCDPKHGANPACLNVGWRHTEPFHQCPECIANLGLNGFTGAVVAQVMREYAEVRSVPGVRGLDV